MAAEGIEDDHARIVIGHGFGFLGDGVVEVSRSGFTGEGDSRFCFVQFLLGGGAIGYFRRRGVKLVEGQGHFTGVGICYSRVSASQR